MREREREREEVEEREREERKGGGESNISSPHSPKKQGGRTCTYLFVGDGDGAGAVARFFARVCVQLYP